MLIWSERSVCLAVFLLLIFVIVVICIDGFNYGGIGGVIWVLCVVEGNSLISLSTVAEISELENCNTVFIINNFWWVN